MRVLVSAVSAASVALLFFACANGSDAVIEVDDDSGSALGTSSSGDSGSHITFGAEDAGRGDAKTTPTSSSSSSSSTSSSGTSGTSTSSSGSSGTSTSSSGSSGTSTSSSSSSSSGSTSGDCTGSTSAGAGESYDFACDDLAYDGYEDDCTPGGTDCNALAGSLGIATWCCFKPKASDVYCSGDFGGVAQCVPK